MYAFCSPSFKKGSFQSLSIACYFVWSVVYKNRFFYFSTRFLQKGGWVTRFRKSDIFSMSCFSIHVFVKKVFNSAKGCGTEDVESWSKSRYYNWHIAVLWALGNPKNHYFCSMLQKCGKWFSFFEGRSSTPEGVKWGKSKCCHFSGKMDFLYAISSFFGPSWKPRSLKINGGWAKDDVFATNTFKILPSIL